MVPSIEFRSKLTTPSPWAISVDLLSKLISLTLIKSRSDPFSLICTGKVAEVIVRVSRRELSLQSPFC